MQPIWTSHFLIPAHLPLATIQDPYTWMQSIMCCHIVYAAEWKQTNDHCPNLVPTKYNLEQFLQQQCETLAPANVQYSN